MDDLSEVLVEVHRLQMLAYIGRAPRGGSFATVWDIAQWLRVPVGEAALLIAELEEEGFVERAASRSGEMAAPLRLTTIGTGVLEWNRRRGRRPASSPPLARPLPEAIV